MATYNGGRFLTPQLESIREQTIAEIDVLASDDGSTDDTSSILESFAANWPKGRFDIVRGPGQGFADNFRSLLARTDIDADYFAFSDQDDIWRPDKLEAAIAWLASRPPDCPALYCSRTELIDEGGRHIGFSPAFLRPPGLRNALVQSIAGGNTMVFNRAAYALLSEAARRTAFLTHDWWSYLLVTAADGEVHYALKPRVLYRQHGNNLVGSNSSWVARVSRLDLLLRGRFAGWTDMNLAGLETCRELLTPPALTTIAEFRDLRGKLLIGRLAALRRMGLYRQTCPGQLSLYAACALNRL